MNENAECDWNKSFNAVLGHLKTCTQSVHACGRR